jgi:CHAD domain-containing protein
VTEPANTISTLDISGRENLSKSCRDVFRDLTEFLSEFAKNAPETTEESTHQIRKKLKFFRAFVKLLKQCRSRVDYASVNILLRDWGREFSELRDAHVRRFLLSDSFSRPEKFQPTVPETLIAINEREIVLLEKRFVGDSNRFFTLMEQLKTSAILSDFFEHLEADPDLVKAGFTESFLKSRDAFQNGVSNKESEQMHEWRKRLKDVQYQMELLMAGSQDLSQSKYPEVVNLCEKLGALNDLHMLIEWVKNVPDSTIKESEINEFLTKRRQQAKSLRNETVEFGTALYESEFSLFSEAES